MQIMSIDNETCVCFDPEDGMLWEKYWVFLLVLETVDRNLEYVCDLDWFSLIQVMGDDIWQFLISQDEHESARRCFEYMVDENLLPVEQAVNSFNGTDCYRVIL